VTGSVAWAGRDFILYWGEAGGGEPGEIAADGGLSSLLSGRDFRHIFWGSSATVRSAYWNRCVRPSVYPHKRWESVDGCCWNAIGLFIPSGKFGDAYLIVLRKDYSTGFFTGRRTTSRLSFRTKTFSGQSWRWGMKYTFYSRILCAQVLQFLR
jgi:hypothetical protein